MNNLPTSPGATRAARLRRAALSAALLLSQPLAMAGPGAHGPNGEHLDAPTTTAAAATALPRMEAHSEAFELVAQLSAAALTVLIDRYDSNEPVLNATLEVESGGVKAQAPFRADEGHYTVDDPRLLALLRQPGEHALVFTLLAGQDSDLLDGTLIVGASPAAGGTPAHHHELGAHDIERAAWTGAGIAALGLVGGLAWWRQRRREAGLLKGGL